MIEKLMRRCGLGEVTEDITAVSGGLMHKMYRVVAESGVYAVKKLNADIMKRHDAMANFGRAERLEAVLEKSGIPMVPALVIGGRKMQQLGGGYYYIFRWQEGSIAGAEQLTAQQCFLAGELLGRVHSVQTEDVFPEAGEPFDMDIGFYIEKAGEQDKELADMLAAERALLENAGDKLNEARRAVPQRVSIINDDMDAKNVMWNGGAPVMIDLECLDTGDPYASCMNLALQWAEKDGDISAERLGAFLTGYSGVCGGLPEDFDRYYGTAYSWLEWLDRSLRRALGMEGSGENDKAEGRREAVAAIKRIRCLEKREAGIRSMIRETAEQTGTSER